jgi:hypothetical protein
MSCDIFTIRISCALNCNIHYPFFKNSYLDYHRVGAMYNLTSSDLSHHIQFV